MRRPFNPELSARLDWAIVRMEATRGWRKWIWRAMKFWYELSI